MFRIYRRKLTTDDPSSLGLSKKNLTSLLAEFLFLPAPFAQRMHLCFGLFVLLRIYRKKLGAVPH